MNEAQTILTMVVEMRNYELILHSSNGTKSFILNSYIIILEWDQTDNY